MKTQVRTISLATPQLTDLGSLAAPAPMIAAVLVWVVETGRPVSVAMSRLAVAETEAAKPWYTQRSTVSMPTFLMIFLPPTAVPMAMTAAQSTMIQSGKPPISPTVMLSESAMASMAVDMNFWPSCAPCMRATPAAPRTCMRPKKLLAVRRSALRHAMGMILEMAQPARKPSTVESTRP